MSIQITFDDLPADTVVTTQYSSSDVEFTTPGIITFDDLAPSPFFALSATDKSGPVEFSDWHIRGQFLHEDHSHVGVSVNRSARLTLFDGSGVEVARTLVGPDSLTPPDNYVYGEIFTGTSNIASFDLWCESQSPFRMDNLIFDNTRVPQEPDFRLLYNGGVVLMKPEATATAEVTVVRLNGSTGPISLNASSLPIPVASADPEPNPFVGGNGETVTITFTAAPWSNSNPIVTGQSLMVMGNPSPPAGLASHSVNIPVTVLEPYDVQIIGIEVTQAIQPFDLPQKQDPEVPEPVKYNGVPLAEGGMTRVRVFCTWHLIGRLSPAFDLKLYGTRDGSSLIGSPISPERGVVPVFLGDTVLPVFRQEQQADFVLPHDWTNGNITLTAVISPIPDFSPAYSFDLNLDNNTFTLTDIIFTTMTKLEIDAFELRCSGTYLAAPWTVFEDAVNLLPLGAGHVLIGYYANVVDITDIATQPNGDGPSGRANDCADRLAHAVNGWNYHADSRTFLVGVYSGDLQYIVGGVTLGDGFWDGLWDWLAGKQRVAVVQDYGRPLTSVAHEIGHLSGRAHAGLGTPPVEPAVDWPPDGTGQINGIGIDRRDGTIHAPGQDESNGANGTIYDFMSYATQVPNDPDFWISVRGWDETFEWFRPRWYEFVSPEETEAVAAKLSFMRADDLAQLVPSQETVQDLIAETSTWKVAKSLITVQATVSGSSTARITILFSSKDQHPLSGPESEYIFVVRNKSGHTLVTAYPQRLPHIASRSKHGQGSHRKSFSLKASLPVTSYTDAAVVELHKHDCVIASRTRPMASPTITNVSVQSVRQSDVMGTGKEITWSSTHAEGLPLLAQLDLLLPATHPFGAVWNNVYTGPAKAVGQSTTSALSDSLFPANSCAKVRLRVSDGFNEVDRVSDEFHCAGLPPRVRIAHPQTGTKYAVGAHIYLRAEAYDDLRRQVVREDRCKGEHTRWTVNDVLIGEGDIVSWVPGPLAWREETRVKFEAVDYLGRSSCAEIELKIVRR